MKTATMKLNLLFFNNTTMWNTHSNLILYDVSASTWGLPYVNFCQEVFLVFTLVLFFSWLTWFCFKIPELLKKDTCCTIKPLQFDFVRQFSEIEYFFFLVSLYAQRFSPTLSEMRKDYWFYDGRWFYFTIALVVANIFFVPYAKYAVLYHIISYCFLSLRRFFAAYLFLF